MKKVLAALGLCCLLVLIAAGWLWSDYKNYLEEPLSISESTIFELPKGHSFNELLEDLEAEGIEIKPLYFKLYGRESGLARQIKAGEYKLTAGLTPKQLLELISSGRSLNYNFTIVEGSTFKQLLQSLADNSNLQDDVSGLSNAELLQQLAVEYSHPEGLFLAETYSFEKNSSALALLQRAHRMLNLQLEKHWVERDPKLPYKSAYEALVMASIVEKETARADERPVIAGVFVRRLNKGMKLQTDPTVIYGMGDRYQGNIRRSDLRKPTPYNTYVIPALPPTPIAMVGPDAIRAALNPTAGKALFFVAKGDGSHYFSATLKEHNDAVRRYQLKRRQDYRSSP